MHCFKHQEAVSIGICFSCSKGVCPNCVVDSSSFITCKERRCIEYAELRYELTKQAPNVYLIANKELSRASILQLGMGIVFFIMVIFYWVVDGFGFLTALFGSLSFIFILFGASRLLKSNKYPVIQYKKG